jgi:putative redox protein
VTEITVTFVRGEGTSTNAKIRNHTVTVDRTVPRGGGNLGPMGGEFLLVALGGCFMSTLIAAAAARNEDLAGATCSVQGVLAESPPRFSDITLTATCDSCDAESFAHLVSIAERGCIVANTLKSALALKVAAVNLAAESHQRKEGSDGNLL